MRRILLVAFYFPPAGGGGVQRPLAFARYLGEFGYDVSVLAPTDPRWIHADPTLRVPAGVRVVRAPYFGPRGRIPAEELYGRSGLDHLARRLRLVPRRLLVPDENVVWALTAVPLAVRIIRERGISVVLTTSPPNSVHLIGAALQALTSVRWVADLRDSIVANPNKRTDRITSRIRERAQRPVAALVARRADAITAATPTIAAELGRIGARSRVAVVANGSDFEAFEAFEYRRSDRFVITHTGSFFGRRSPRPFLQAITDADEAVVARFVGDFRKADREWAEPLQEAGRLELLPFVAHERALELQRSSDALLLLLPDVGDRGLDVPSGKLFEYLAARRPIIAAVPPEGAAARLIRHTGGGIVVPPDDVDAMRSAVAELVAEWRAGALGDVVLASETQLSLSRRTRVGELAAVLDAIR